MATDYGTDISTFASGTAVPDLDPTMATITGARVVLEAVARRLMTPYGMLPEAPDGGIDVRSLLNDALPPSRILAYETSLAAEAAKDERVLQASCSLSFASDTGALRIELGVQLREGTFPLVLDVTAAGVAVAFDDAGGT